MKKGSEPSMRHVTVVSLPDVDMINVILELAFQGRMICSCISIFCGLWASVRVMLPAPTILPSHV